MDRDSALVSFLEVSGMEDTNVAMEVLEAHGWNVQQALDSIRDDATHVTSGPTTRSSAAATPMDTEPTNNNNNNNNNNHRQGGWLSRVLRSVLGGQPERGSVDQQRARDSERLHRQLQQRYGEESVPTPMLTSFNEAIKASSREFKMLVVYLHSELHDNTDDFCRHTLCNASLAEFLRDNFLFWMGSTQTVDGFNVANTLGATNYPFVAAVSCQNTTISVVDVRDGPMSRQEMMDWLGQVLDHFQPELIASRADEDSRAADRRLREEQEQAYNESRMADAMRMRREEDKRLRAEQQRLDEEMAERREKELEEEKKEIRKRRRLQAQESLPPEPVDADEATAVTLAFRTRSGSRLMRKFLWTDTLETLYTFVASTEDGGDFSLCTSFPKQQLPRVPTALHAAGLAPHTMILVEGVEEDDDEDIKTG